MKKRAISSLLATLIVVSFILPALATETGGDTQPPVDVQAEAATGADAAVSSEPDAEADAAGNAEPEPKSFVFLDDTPQFVEYELRDGTTYVTVSSFVAMVDPQAEVVEKDGVVTVTSARTEQVVDDEGNTTNVVRETLNMTVSAQVPYIVANNRYLYAKDSITTVNGSVAAPIRKLALVFNLDVDYDAVAHAALLLHVQDRSAYIQPGDSYYDAEELYWMSRIIYAESGNQPLDGMIAVGNVVMNRVNSSQYPNTIYDVLNQKNQFVPPSSLSKRTPTSQSIVAAKLVLDGAEVLPTALYFNMKGMSSFASRNRPYVATIGDHAFYA